MLERTIRWSVAPARRLFIVLLALLVGVTALVPVTESPASGATADQPPIGVYRGPGPWGSSKIPAYESFLGRPVDYVLDFQDDDSWANQTWPSWQANAWQAADKTVILGGVGTFPGDWNRNFNGQTMSWAAAARGEYDSYWRLTGERLVASGQAGAILRGAHEFNGGWFPHRVEEKEIADFIAAWRRWVDIMRAVPGNRFTFDWNPTEGQHMLRNAERAYPGDAWVDRVAIDVYDGWYTRGWKPGGTSAPPTAAEQDAMWNHILNGERGLVFWRNFAASRNKPMSFPEWGLRTWKDSDGLIHGGGDNPRFIERMHAIITDPAWNVDYHAFWEDPGVGVSDLTGRHIDVPESRATFLRLFGGAASAAPPTTEAPPTTAPPTTAPPTTSPPTTAPPTTAPVPELAPTPASPGEVTLVGASSNGDNGSTSSLRLALPDDVRAGDRIVVGVQVQQSVTSLRTPAGYQVLADVVPTRSWHPRLVAYSRIAAGGETHVSVPTGWVGKSGVAMVYRGADPEAAVTVLSSASTDRTTVSVAGGSVPVDGSQLVMITGAQNHSAPAGFSPVSGLVERTEMSSLRWLAIGASDATVSAGPAGEHRTAFEGGPAALTAVALAIAPSPREDDTATTPPPTTVPPTTVPPTTVPPTTVPPTTVPPTTVPPAPAGEVSLVGATSAGDNGNTSALRLELPGDVRAGDRIVVAVQVSGSVSSLRTPAGFEVAAEVRPARSWHPRLVVYSRTATGGESVVSVPTGWVGKAGVALVYRGVDPSAPVHVLGARTVDGRSIRLASASVPAAGSRLVMVSGAQNHSSPAGFGAATGMVERAEVDSLRWLAISASDATVPSGPSGERSVAFGTSTALGAVLLALVPA